MVSLLNFDLNMGVGSEKVDEKKKKKQLPTMKEPPGAFSRSLFCWMFPLFYRGNYRDLEEEDLVPPKNQYNSKLVGDQLERYVRIIHLKVGKTLKLNFYNRVNINNRCLILELENPN